MSETMSEQEYLESTRKQALYLWSGLNLMLALFFVQSQIVFIKSSPLPSSGLEWVITVLGIITFLFGILFFKNYMALRKKRIMKMPAKERKQTVLLAFVMQFILFESLGMYGVFLSVMMQNTLKAVPFVICAYIGFVLSFPKKEKISPFFK